MRKFLPLILLLLGAAVLVGVFMFVKGDKDESGTPDEEKVAVISQAKMPEISLSKTTDGHYINLKIENLDKLSADTLDYELLYEVPGEEQPQGTGSSVAIGGKDSFEVDILLGTESSGKFRYDEGVEKGTLTLKFRDEKGKLLGRTRTEFDLASAEAETTSY